MHEEMSPEPVNFEEEEYHEGLPSEIVEVPEAYQEEPPDDFILNAVLNDQEYESSEKHSQHMQLELNEESEEEGRYLQHEGEVSEDHDQFADINNDDDLNRAIV